MPWTLRTTPPATPGRPPRAINTAVPLDRPRVLAILNVTPDSFSDGGVIDGPEAAVRAAAAAVADGADALDVGGESTRPGAARVDPAEQRRRVLPVLRAIRAAGITVPITIDTTRAEVAHAALDAGADAINDVSGGTEDPGMLPLAARLGVGIILMHRLTPPDRDVYSDQYTVPPQYTDVVEEVAAALAALAARAEAAGVARDAIVLDPGLGFGKSVQQNLDLIRGTPRLATLGYPLLAGASRKSFTARAGMAPGATEPPPAQDRLAESLALSLAQVAGGARLVRVHDVSAHARALRAWWRAVGPGGGEGGDRHGE